MADCAADVVTDEELDGGVLAGMSEEELQMLLPGVTSFGDVPTCSHANVLRLCIQVMYMDMHVRCVYANDLCLVSRDTYSCTPVPWRGPWRLNLPWGPASPTPYHISTGVCTTAVYTARLCWVWSLPRQASAVTVSEIRIN